MNGRVLERTRRILVLVRGKLQADLEKKVAQDKLIYKSGSQNSLEDRDGSRLPSCEDQRKTSVVTHYLVQLRALSCLAELC